MFSSRGNSSGASEVVVVPRNFKLLEDLETFEKGGDPRISAGLKDPCDLLLIDWHASIIGAPGTPFQNRIYSLSIHCPPNYPTSPPIIRFSNKINMRCVDQRGMVSISSISNFQWQTATSTLPRLLIALADEMKNANNRRLTQPNDSEIYS